MIRKQKLTEEQSEYFESRYTVSPVLPRYPHLQIARRKERDEIEVWQTGRDDGATLAPEQARELAKLLLSLTDPKDAEFTHCNMCDSLVKVTGKTTLHYDPIWREACDPDTELEKVANIAGEIRELIWKDYPESQAGMIGSPAEVLACALDWIKKKAGRAFEQLRKANDLLRSANTIAERQEGLRTGTPSRRS